MSAARQHDTRPTGATRAPRSAGVTILHRVAHGADPLVYLPLVGAADGCLHFRAESSTVPGRVYATRVALDPRPGEREAWCSCVAGGRCWHVTLGLLVRDRYRDNRDVYRGMSDDGLRVQVASWRDRTRPQYWALRAVLAERVAS